MCSVIAVASIFSRDKKGDEEKELSSDIFCYGSTGSAIVDGQMTEMLSNYVMLLHGYSPTSGELNHTRDSSGCWILSCE